MHLDDDAFFIPGAQISIEARGPEPMERRHAVSLLRKLSDGAKMAIAGAALAAGVGATAQTPLPSEADSQQLQQWTQQSLESFAATTRRSVHLRIDAKASPIVNNELPMMVMGTGAEANVCHVSLVNLDKLMEVAFGKEADPVRVQRTRDAMVLHEAAHCEAFSQLGHTPGATVNVLAQQSLRHHQLLTRATPATSIGLVGLESTLNTLTMEKQADAKALLHLAYRSLKDAISPAEIQAGLQQFDTYVADIKHFRKFESDVVSEASNMVFHDHDSSDVVQFVQTMVHEGAKDLSSFKRDVLNPEKSTDAAMKIAVGAIRASFSEIQKTFIEVDVAKTNVVLKNAGDQIHELEADLAKMGPPPLVKASKKPLGAVAVEESRQERLTKQLDEMKSFHRSLSESREKVAALLQAPMPQANKIELPKDVQDVAAQVDQFVGRYGGFGKSASQTIDVAHSVHNDDPQAEVEHDVKTVAPKTNGAYLMNVLGVRNLNDQVSRQRRRMGSS